MANRTSPAEVVSIWETITGAQLNAQGRRKMASRREVALLQKFSGDELMRVGREVQAPSKGHLRFSAWLAALRPEPIHQTDGRPTPPRVVGSPRRRPPHMREVDWLKLLAEEDAEMRRQTERDLVSKYAPCIHCGSVLHKTQDCPTH
jgi:hypothetical protein